MAESQTNIQEGLKYPGCPDNKSIDVMGSDSPHVRLISTEGDVFYVSREQALFSRTLTSMLSVYEEMEGEVEAECMLVNISTTTLAVICEYLVYKEKYTHHATEIPDMAIKTEVAMDVLNAAYYLAI